jgi:hypothetical protein
MNKHKRNALLRFHGNTEHFSIVDSWIDVNKHKMNVLLRLHGNTGHFYIVDSCIYLNKHKRNYCCVSMVTLNTFVLLTAVYTWISIKGTYCCVSMVTVVARIRHNVTFIVHNIFCLQSMRYHQIFNDIFPQPTVVFIFFWTLFEN